MLGLWLCDCNVTHSQSTNLPIPLGFGLACIRSFWRSSAAAAAGSSDQVCCLEATQCRASRLDSVIYFFIK